MKKSTLIKSSFFTFMLFTLFIGCGMDPSLEQSNKDEVKATKQASTAGRFLGNGMLAGACIKGMMGSGSTCSDISMVEEGALVMCACSNGSTGIKECEIEYKITRKFDNQTCECVSQTNEPEVSYKNCGTCQC